MEVKLVLPDDAVSAQLEDLWGRFSEEDRRTILREAVVQWIDKNPSYYAGALEDAVKQAYHPYSYSAPSQDDLAKRISAQLGVKSTHAEYVRGVVREAFRVETQRFIMAAFASYQDDGYVASLIKGALEAAKSSMEQMIPGIVHSLVLRSFPRDGG